MAKTNTLILQPSRNVRSSHQAQRAVKNRLPKIKETIQSWLKKKTACLSWMVSNQLRPYHQRNSRARRVWAWHWRILIWKAWSKVSLRSQFQLAEPAWVQESTREKESNPSWTSKHLKYHTFNKQKLHKHLRVASLNRTKQVLCLRLNAHRWRKERNQWLLPSKPALKSEYSRRIWAWICTPSSVPLATNLLQERNLQSTGQPRLHVASSTKQRPMQMNTGSNSWICQKYTPKWKESHVSTMTNQSTWSKHHLSWIW